MTDHPNSGVSRSTQTITLISAIILGLANFYEPAKDLYLRYAHPDLGSESVEIAFEQQKLTEKNLDCLTSAAPRQMYLDNNVSVNLVGCPSGDVQVTIYPANAPAKQRWVPSAPAKATSAFDWLIGAAKAAEAEGAAQTGAPVRMAQASFQTVCQAWQDERRKSKLVRVTNEGGRCFKEVVNVFTGRVEVRQEVPCNAACR
jgi:hypothetical protein